MYKLQEIKMLIRIWWMNLFSKHKLVPRFKQKPKQSNLVYKPEEIEIFKLEDFYE